MAPGARMSSVYSRSGRPSRVLRSWNLTIAKLLFDSAFCQRFVATAHHPRALIISWVQPNRDLELLQIVSLAMD